MAATAAESSVEYLHDDGIAVAAAHRMLCTITMERQIVNRNGLLNLAGRNFGLLDLAGRNKWILYHSTLVFHLLS